MAAIVPTTFSPYKVLKNVTAEAAGTSTSWFEVPQWVKSVLVTYNFTAAAAGSGHSVVVTVRAADPVSADDTNDHGILLTSATITGVSFHHYALAPTFTTAGTDSATADSSVVQNSPLPSVLGIRVVNASGTGATYTYTLTVRFVG